MQHGPTSNRLGYLHAMTLALLVVIFAGKNLLLAIDKGDFTGVSPEYMDKVFQSFDGKGFYLTDEKGNTVANKWTQTSKIDAPPAFTAKIDGRYVLLFLKKESAEKYGEYWHHAFGVKSIVREAGLPQIFEKIHNSAIATNIVVEPDLVITESRNITPVEPIYFKDPATQKPYVIEVNSTSFTPCFMLKEDADAFGEKISRVNKKAYIPVKLNFKDFLQFVETEVGVEHKIRVFTPPVEEKIKKYIETLKAQNEKSE